MVLPEKRTDIKKFELICVICYRNLLATELRVVSHVKIPSNFKK